MYDENGKYIEPKDSIRNLLLEKGIIVDTSRKTSNCIMLVKDGVDIGYFTAGSAYKKFIENKD